MNEPIEIRQDEEINYNISFTTTFETTEVILFGLKLDVAYDLSDIQVIEISGQDYNWNIKIKGENLERYGENLVTIFAVFMDYNGNVEEQSKELKIIKKGSFDLIINENEIKDYNVSFTTTFEAAEVILFGLKLNITYDVSDIQVTEISGQNYNWNIKIKGLTLESYGENLVTISAVFMDYNGNVEEQQNSIIVYKLLGNNNQGSSLNFRPVENYIQLKANINKEVYQDENGNYGIYGSTIDETNINYEITYRLPEGEGRLNLKKMEVKGLTENLLGNFDLVVDISSTGEGILVPKAHFIGSSITESIEEDLTKAQVLYVNQEVEPSVTPDTTDNLQITITEEYMNNLYEQKLRNIENLYNGSIIESWIINVLAVLPNENSLLNQINIYKGGNRNIENFFNNGESITLSIGNSFEYSIKDKNSTIEIIPQTTIYAVITQDSNAPRLNI